MENNFKCFFLERMLNVSRDIDSTFYAVCFTVNIAFSLTATVGNLLVIAAVWKTPALQTPSNVLLCCLALTDLGVGVLAQPSTAIYEIASFGKHVKVACIAGVVAESAAWTLSTITFLTITVISIEKYLALYLHLRYQELVTNSRVLKVFVLLWPLVILLSLLRIWFWQEAWFQSLKTTGVFLFGGACFVATPFAYFKIFKLVRHHQLRIHELNRVTSHGGKRNHVNLVKYRKSIMANLAVLLTLFICYLPFIIVEYLTRVAPFTSFLLISHHIGAILIFISSSLNPVLLYWRLGEVRRAIKSVLKEMGLLTTPFVPF